MSAKPDELPGLLRDLRLLVTETAMTRQGATRPRPVLAVERLMELAAARVHGRGGAGVSGSGDHSDPTAQAVLDEQRQAEAARLRKDALEIVDAVESAVRGLQLAEKLTAHVLEPNRPVNYRPGCANCERVTMPDGTAHPEAYQEVKARGLCGWCYRFQYGDGPKRPGYGQPPTLTISRWHLDHLGTETPGGLMVPRALIRDEMPDAYAVREQRLRAIRTEAAPHPRGHVPPSWARPDTDETARCANTRWLDGVEYGCALSRHGHEVECEWVPLGEEVSA